MIDTPARVAFLKKIHLFYGLEDAELEAIATAMEEVRVPNGEVIFKQDTPSESFYMIHEGSVRIVRKQGNKEEQLAVLVSNDYFGEMGLIGRRKRTGTVTATSDTLLFVLTRAKFEKIYKLELAQRLPRLKNFNVAVREWHDQIVFLRKIVPGGADKFT